MRDARPGRIDVKPEIPLFQRLGRRTLPREAHPHKAPGPKSPGTLAVATYNIHSCVGADGRCNPERIAAVLLELDVDIVALQEVGRRNQGWDQGRFLSEATGLHVIAAAEHHDYRGRFGNAILSRWPAGKARVIDLTAGIHGPRNAIDAEFEIDGKTLRVIATHFGLGGSERWAQTRRLLEAITDWPEDDTLKSALLMLGDLNEWRGRAGGIPALERRFRARSPVPLSGQNPKTPLPRTFPAWMPVLPLDRIYAAAPARLYDFHVHRSAMARKASDHLPLYARLVWPN